MNTDINILVVEDEKPLADAIRSKLELNGFSVVQARSAEQALGYLGDLKIGVIWLDHYLFGQEDGLDLVVKIKQDDNWKDIPIFVVSNTASADKVKSYLALGVSKYFTKSDFRLDQIILDIKNYLSKKHE
jgi:DNA-binding response OmpR family regulator